MKDYLKLLGIIGLIISYILIPVIFSGCGVEAEPVEFLYNLYWTAPGDNGNIGTASEYDLRYSTEVITAGNFYSAERIITGVPEPSIAGTVEHAVVLVVAESDIPVYFALRTSDEEGNWSELSNVYSEKTPDIIAPAAVIDLRGIE